MADYTIPKHEEKGHSLLSPSSAHRWMRCPGAVHLEKTIAETISEPAEEGTAAHWAGEQRLSGGVVVVLGDTITTPAGLKFEVTQEMLDSLDIYYKAVAEMESELGASVQVEQHVVLIGGLIEGTCDALVVGDNEAKANDLKYGQGVEVDPEHNEQAQIYTLAAVKNKGFTGDAEIEIIITQPRHFKSEKVKSWFTTYGALMTWYDFVLLPAVDRVKAASAEGPFVPGDKQCRFCKAAKAGQCPALIEFGLTFGDQMDAAPMAFPVPVTEFSPEQMAAALHLRSKFKAWSKMVDRRFEEVETRAKDMLEGGFTVPGHKLVHGRRSAAKWTDEAAAIALANESGIDPHEEKLKTVAVMRTEFKEKGIAIDGLLKLSEAKQGKSVVPITDKKAALTPKVNPEDLFKDN